MRRSCCYAPDILEMLQADLVMFFLSAFRYARLFLCRYSLFSASRMGKSLIELKMVSVEKGLRPIAWVVGMVRSNMMFHCFPFLFIC